MLALFLPLGEYNMFEQFTKMIMMIMVARTGATMLQFEPDTAMTRSSAMAVVRSLDRQLNVVVPEMDTTSRDVQRLLDVYGPYLETKERSILLEFLEPLRLGSYMARRTKAITNRLKREGIIYPRE